MNKKGSKLFAVILSLCMALTLFPSFAFAETDTAISGEDTITESTDDTVTAEDSTSETEEEAMSEVKDGEKEAIIQDNEQQDIYVAYFEHSYLWPGVKAGDVKFEEFRSGTSELIINYTTISQNGIPLGYNDKISTDANVTTTITITFIPRDGYYFKNPVRARVQLWPKNRGAITEADAQSYYCDTITANSDGSYTATWSSANGKAAKVPEAVGDMTLRNKDTTKSLDPVIGGDPGEPELLSKKCSLVKYEWSEDVIVTPYESPFAAGHEYALTLWLKANDGYTFTTYDSGLRFDSPRLDKLNLSPPASLDPGLQYIYYSMVEKDPTTDKEVVPGSMVRVDISYNTLLQHVSGVSVSPTNYTFTEAGETIQLTAMVTPSDASNKNVTWKSSNKKVATVDSNGKVTAVKNGTCTITATTEDGGLSAVCSVMVAIPLPATSKVTLTNTASAIKVSWKTVKGAKSYDIYCNDIVAANGVTDLSFMYYGADTNGKKYTFKVVPRDSVTSGPAKTKSIYWLSRTKISSVKNGSAGKMTVKWSKNSKAKGYKLQYSTTKDFSKNVTTFEIQGASKTSKTIIGLKKGKTYYVRVRSYKSTSTSAWSAKKSLNITK